VLRQLVRPCLALTSVVQLGKGIYREEQEERNGIEEKREININMKVEIDVDACTFDKVLLYLEHEARGEPFRFDPLIATELREAAVTLGEREGKNRERETVAERERF
jgi:hypothetical protein